MLETGADFVLVISLTPKGIKRSKTQADEGLTTADEAGYVALRQPPASKQIKIDVNDKSPEC
jgi:hypothetical protein